MALHKRCHTCLRAKRQLTTVGMNPALSAGTRLRWTLMPSSVVWSRHCPRHAHVCVELRLRKKANHDAPMKKPPSRHNTEIKCCEPSSY